jgi:hypothetical protein
VKFPFREKSHKMCFTKEASIKDFPDVVKKTCLRIIKEKSLEPSDQK